MGGGLGAPGPLESPGPSTALFAPAQCYPQGYPPLRGVAQSHQHLRSTACPAAAAARANDDLDHGPLPPLPSPASRPSTARRLHRLRPLDGCKLGHRYCCNVRAGQPLHACLGSPLLPQPPGPIRLSRFAHDPRPCSDSDDDDAPLTKAREPTSKPCPSMPALRPPTT